MTSGTRTPGITQDARDLLVRPPKYPSTEVKEVLGGRWDAKEKAWRLAPTALNVITLVEWYGTEFIDGSNNEVEDLFFEGWGFSGFSAHPDLEALAHAHPKWSTLYLFQQIAVEYLVCNPHRGSLLGLSPGLGKTPVSIVAADVLELRKVLILAPLTLAKNWGKEIAQWADHPRQWSRATAAVKEPETDVVITNFETVFYTICRDEDGNVFTPEADEWVTNARKVKAWIQEGPTKRDPKTGKVVPVRERITQARPTYSEVEWDLLIVDESILLKNRKAVKVEIIQQLAKYSQWVWLLSGSPTAKFRDDLYPQIKTIMPRGFASYWRFAEFFSIVEKGQWGWNITGDRPDHDPQKYLKDFLFVRNQKDVLPDLPDYIYNPIEIDLNPDQQVAFQKMVDEWVIQLDDDDEAQESANRLAQLTRMQQITSNLCNLEKATGKPVKSSSAKEDLLVSMIEQGDIEFPLLVWAWYVPSANSIYERLSQFKDLRVGVVTGQMKASEKDSTIERYKDGGLDVLILQTGTGKFGHTLTDTRTVFYHDRSFDSDAYLQSLRRVKRIGLSHSPRLIVPRAKISADPLIEMNLAGKLESVSKVASHDLKELLLSLGSLTWSVESADV